MKQENIISQKVGKMGRELEQEAVMSPSSQFSAISSKDNRMRESAATAVFPSGYPTTIV